MVVGYRILRSNQHSICKNIPAPALRVYSPGCGDRSAVASLMPCGIPCAGSSGDENVRSCGDHRFETSPNRFGEHSRRLQLVQTRRIPPRYADRDRGAARGDRRQDGMHSDSAFQAHVHAGRRVVEMAPAERDQSHGQTAHLDLAGPPGSHPLGAIATVDEQTLRAVDEDVVTAGSSRNGRRNARAGSTHADGSATGEDATRDETVGRTRGRGKVTPTTVRNRTVRPSPCERHPWRAGRSSGLGRTGRERSDVSPERRQKKGAASRQWGARDAATRRGKIGGLPPTRCRKRCSGRYKRNHSGTRTEPNSLEYLAIYQPGRSGDHPNYRR